MDSLSLLTTTPSFSSTSKPLLSNTLFSIPSPNPPTKSPPKSKSKERQSLAFPDSLPLHSKNPHAVCRDIQRLARADRLREALSVLDYLQHRGVPVNATTFSSLLSAASRAKSLPLLRQIHVHIRIHSLHSNEFLQSKLIQTYTILNSPEDAEEILSHLQPKTPYPFNALLRGNIVVGQSPVPVFENMGRAGISGNEYTFSCLLKSFAGSPAFSQGLKAHALLVKNGLYHGSLILRTGLIDMYFKCRKIRWAMKVFDEIPETERDVVLFGAVVAGFAHNKLRMEAMEYLRLMGREGIELNSVIVTTVLPVIGELSERNLGREVHGFVIKKFRYCNKLVSVQSGLIDMYCKCGDMASGRRVFYGSRPRNAVSWTALMSGYASNGRLEQALRSVVWMQQEGVRPDVVTIATAIPVCARLRALRQGMEIHAYVFKNRFLPNVSISSSLMTMYSECRKLDSSCRVFDGMSRKNVIAWTALIDSYARNGQLVDAFHVFRSMGLGQCRPDAVSIGRVLSISGKLEALKLGKEIHGQVYKMKLEAIPFLMAEVVRMYGKCGEIWNASKVFHGVDSKGSLTCTAIIEAYGCNGLYRDAVDLFRWMRSNGFLPNHFTFDAVLSICERAGFVEDALDVFDSMVRDYKLIATRDHCDCLISLLDRSGRISEAQKFIYLRSTLE